MTVVVTGHAADKWPHKNWKQ